MGNQAVEDPKSVPGEGNAIFGERAGNRGSNTTPAQPWYRPKQQRAISTVDALLDATITELEEFGETGLRQERILETSGVAQGSLYHHFGSRDGLIDAAYNEIFIREVDRMLALVEASVDADLRPGTMTERALNAITEMTDPSHYESRRKRLMVLAAALKRPGLAELVAIEQHRITNQIAAIVEDLQAGGVVDETLDPRAVAAFLQAYSFGQMLMLVDVQPPDLDEFRRVVRSALVGLAPRSA